MAIFRVMSTEEEYLKINGCTKNYSILGYQYSEFVNRGRILEKTKKFWDINKIIQICCEGGEKVVKCFSDLEVVDRLLDILH